MADEQAIAEIQPLLDGMAASYGAKDADGVGSASAGEDTVIVGTGADEVRFGATEVRAQVERDMSRVDALSFGIDNSRASVFGGATVAYADATLSGSAEGNRSRFRPV